MYRIGTGIYSTMWKVVLARYYSMSRVDSFNCALLKRISGSSSQPQLSNYFDLFIDITGTPFAQYIYSAAGRYPYTPVLRSKRR
jgi:hypothetical protein